MELMELKYANTLLLHLFKQATQTNDAIMTKSVGSRNNLAVDFLQQNDVW